MYAFPKFKMMFWAIFNFLICSSGLSFTVRIWVMVMVRIRADNVWIKDRVRYRDMAVVRSVVTVRVNTTLSTNP